MNKRYAIRLAGSLALLTVVLYTLQNCGESIKTFNPGANTTVGDDNYVQIERLARPAVNEGLVISNDNLNAFNSIPPTLDLATSNPAVLAVLSEASQVLDAVDLLDNTNHFGDGFNSEVVAGFLPDVMRIDTSVSIPVGTPAYNADLALIGGTAPILTGGRKLEDDVIDITLSYLVAKDASGAAVKDNVSYAGEPGNSSQGHSKLYQQSSYNGSAQFPFLAAPY